MLNVSDIGSDLVRVTLQLLLQGLVKKGRIDLAVGMQGRVEVAEQELVLQTVLAHDRRQSKGPDHQRWITVQQPAKGLGRAPHGLVQCLHHVSR